MDRTKFFKKVTIDGVEQLDHLYNSLSNLVARRPVSFSRLSILDRKRPDLTSYRIYGTVDFWWIYLVFNGIQDPFFETTVGRVVKLPHWLDIFDFTKEFKVR